MNKTISRFYCGLVFILIICAVLGSIPGTAFAQAEEQYIKFDYLKRIEGTPFAEKIHTVIKVPVYDNHKIEIADVKKALKLKSFGVMQSYCDTFEYDATTDTYTAVYYKSVYLNAKTVDGNSMNYYLDCNLSYEDYYGGFVDKDIVDRGLYEYYLNKIHVTYPNLDGYSSDNIYGYWGVVIIPHGNDLNQLWANMFGSSTNYSGELKTFLYTKNLKASEYNKLLNDYQYGWLEIAWKDIIGGLTGWSFEADFFIVYCDSQSTEVFIAENGATSADDNHGAMFNGIKDAANAAINAVKTFFSDKKNVALVIGLFIGVIILAGIILAIVLAVKNMAKSVTKEAVKTKNKNGR